MGSRPALLHDNLDGILEWTIEWTMKLVIHLEKAPWIFEQRYLGHIVVGRNARMTVLQKIPV